MIDDLFGKLRKRVDDELKFENELLLLKGALDMVLAQVGVDTFGKCEVGGVNTWDDPTVCSQPITSMIKLAPPLLLTRPRIVLTSFSQAWDVTPSCII